MSIDPGLGLVVMAFRNDAGAVTSTIPTQKQLDTYRQARLQDHTPGSDMSGTGKPNAAGPSATGAGDAVPATVAKTDALASTVAVAPVAQTEKTAAPETQALPASPASAASPPTSSPPQPALA